MFGIADLEATKAMLTLATGSDGDPSEVERRAGS